MNRWWITFAATAALATSFFACDETVTTEALPKADASDDVVTVPEAGSDATVPPSADLQILQISDWHGQLEPVSENDKDGVAQQYGGIGVLKAYFDKDRASNPNTLVFAAGDSWGATPILSNLLGDQPAVAGLNYLGLTADTFGNHNFDNGTAAAKDLIAKATYKLVSTNLNNVAAELGPNVVTPFYMTEVGNAAKVKVAVLGITNPDAPTLVFPGRLGTITIADPIKSANDAAAAARAAGANVVVCLVHMGATGKDGAGEPVGPALDFAQGLKGVDVVLADHTDVQFQKVVGGALVVENRSHGRTYARIAVKVENGAVTSKKAEIIDPIGVHTALLTCEAGAGTAKCPCPDTPCPSTFDCRTSGTTKACQKDEITADPGANTLLDPFRAQLSAKLDVKIGTTAGLFPRGNYPTTTDPAIERVKEAAIGDLVADALLDAYKTSDGAQIVFTNGGGLRDSIPAGSLYKPAATSLIRPPASAPWDVTVGDARAVLIFNNATVVRKITGKLLWDVLEFSVSQLPKASGGFLQIAGFKFTFDRSKTPRVQSVTLDDGAKAIPSNDTTEYTMVTNDFTNSGGDGYAMLKETTPSAARGVMFDLLVDFIKKKGTLDPAVYPTNTRIKDVTP